MVAILTFALAACGTPQQTVQEDSSTVVAQPSNIEDPEQNAPDPTKASEADGKTLIVYFSWSSSGNTEKMANYIQEQTGGDLLKLEPQNPYPKDYNETGDIAKTERDENARPEIANLPDSVAEYDTIFLGYPKMEYSL